jgi:isopenicillin N synthase-like dioxygenase
MPNALEAARVSGASLPVVDISGLTSANAADRQHVGAELRVACVDKGFFCDFGGLTLLRQDNVGGLQVWDQSSDGWIHADPLPGTYVVNLGDMISRWTNNRYRSTVHRVVNASGRERYSVPFFYTGNYAHKVECIPTCLGPGETLKYPPTTVDAHMREMYRQTYKG